MTHTWIVGIDIAKDKFDVCIKLKQPTGTILIKGSSQMKNSPDGFDELWQWTLKRTKADNTSLGFVMEATGVYYENLAHYLFEKGSRVYVVLATKAKNYARSLNIKTKTDKIDAALLAQMGIERTLSAWQPMSDIYIELRDATRAILALQSDKTTLESRLHAVRHSKNQSKAVIEIYEKQIESIQSSIDQLKKHRHSLVDKDSVLKGRIQNLVTIKGVGFDTAIAIVSETNGFTLFTNMRQLVSYAGLDVSHDDSGKRIGNTKISKKGNVRIRQILFMPALAAVRSNIPIRNLHERIKERNPKHPIKGVVASMRKLLLVMYTLWKKEEVFQENHQWNKK